MQIPFVSQLVRLIGIDLGSERIRIWTDRSGFAVDEPAVLAVDTKTRRVLAVGAEAAQMEGRVNPAIVIHYPIRNGVIYDLDTAQALLKLLLQRVLKSTNLLSPVIMASVPAKSTESSLNAVTKLMYSLGAKEVYTISQPLAASIGSGVPIADASGSFVLHMGAGLVEGAVISLGSMVSSRSTEAAGGYLTSRIQHRLNHDLSLSVSSSNAEKVKEKTLSAYSTSERKQLVAGKDTLTGSPKEIAVTAQDLLPELNNNLEKYELLLRKLLSDIPPELTVDVIDKGLLLSGGLAQIDGLSQYFVERMGIPVSVVDNPDRVVIEGISTALEHLELFKESLGYQRT